jgi:hypothetical protein
LRFEGVVFGWVVLPLFGLARAERGLLEGEEDGAGAELDFVNAQEAVGGDGGEFADDAGGGLEFGDEVF